MTLEEQGRGPANVAFAADGRVVTAGADGITLWNKLIWSRDRKKLAERLCSLVSRNLTRDEWAQFLGTRAYHRTCPGWPAAPAN